MKQLYRQLPVFRIRIRIKKGLPDPDLDYSGGLEIRVAGDGFFCGAGADFLVQLWLRLLLLLLLHCKCYFYGILL